MFFLIFLKISKFFLPLWNMHIEIHIFLEILHKGGKVHEASHLKIKEVAIQVDATLHQVVVDDGRVEVFHEVLAATVFI